MTSPTPEIIIVNFGKDLPKILLCESIGGNLGVCIVFIHLEKFLLYFSVNKE